MTSRRDLIKFAALGVPALGMMGCASALASQRAAVGHSTAVLLPNPDGEPEVLTAARASEAVLFLSGEGALESRVEAMVNDRQIKRTFFARPKSRDILDERVCFQMIGDYIDGQEVRFEGDDVAPIHTETGTVWGNHGFWGGRATAKDHGLTADEVGKRYAESDSGEEIVILQILDDDTFVIAKVDRNTNPVDGTYIKVNGSGPSSFTITVAARQVYPAFSGHTNDLYVDGQAMDLAEGAYAYTDKVEFVESAEILQRSDWIAAFENGQISDGFRPTRPGSLAVSFVHTFDRYGGYTCSSRFRALAGGIGIREIYAIQAGRSGASNIGIPWVQPMVVNGERFDFARMPSATVVGEGQNANVYIEAANCDPAPAPLAPFAVQDLGSSVFVIGFVPVEGAGDERRVNATRRVWHITSGGKLYGRSFHRGGISQWSEGEGIDFISFRHVLPKVAPRVCAVFVQSGSVAWLYAYWVGVNVTDTIPVPIELQGRSINAQAGHLNNCSLHDDQAEDAIRFNVRASGSYGAAAVQLR